MYVPFELEQTGAGVTEEENIKETKKQKVPMPVWPLMVSHDAQLALDHEKKREIGGKLLNTSIE